MFRDRIGILNWPLEGAREKNDISRSSKVEHTSRETRCKGHAHVTTTSSKHCRHQRRRSSKLDGDATTTKLLEVSTVESLWCCRTPRARIRARNRRKVKYACTRSSDPSYKRRYRYLRWLISNERLIGSPCERVFPETEPPEKAFAARFTKTVLRKKMIEKV